MWYAKTYVPLQAGSIDGTDTVPHDHAVQRAQRARYVPPKEKNGVTGDPYKTIFVGRLNPESTEESLASFFSQYGTLKKAEITRNLVTGDSRGYGFVEFQSERDCRDAYMNANKSTLDGRQILVDYERSRIMEGWVPRRLGGGFGGRKESGQLRFGARDRPFKRPFKLKDYQSTPSIDPEQRYDDCWRRPNPLDIPPRRKDSNHSHEVTSRGKRERSREDYRSRDDEARHTRDPRRSSYFNDERPHRSRNRDESYYRERERERHYDSGREKKRYKREQTPSPSRHRRSHRSTRHD